MTLSLDDKDMAQACPLSSTELLAERQGRTEPFSRGEPLCLWLAVYRRFGLGLGHGKDGWVAHDASLITHHANVGTLAATFHAVFRTNAE